MTWHHPEFPFEVEMSVPRQTPRFATSDELAEHLRTTRKAIYGMVSRGTLPRPLHRGRKLLFDLDEVLSFLSESRATSPAKE